MNKQLPGLTSHGDNTYFLDFKFLRFDVISLYFSHPLYTAFTLNDFSMLFSTLLLFNISCYEFNECTSPFPILTLMLLVANLENTQ